MRLLTIIFIFIPFVTNAEVKNIWNLPACGALDSSAQVDFGSLGMTKNWDRCWANYQSIKKDFIYEGEWFGGYLVKGSMTWTTSGFKYEGEFRNGLRTERGQYFFEKRNSVASSQIDSTTTAKSLEQEHQQLAFERERLEQEMTNKLAKERQQLAEERRRLEDERRQREQARNNQRINLQVSNTAPTSDGSFTITIQTNSDTASLKLNGEELGGRSDGVYLVNRVARAGQDTKLDIVARDVYGNTDSKAIVVTRTVADSAPRYASLDPARVKVRASTDSVAIIIGIQNYKRVPKAEFANSDAKEFQEYAIRGLGIKTENIKLLLDEDADEVNIVKAFENWLPLQVTKNKTDVYVFYSGHGLPSNDGKSLYFLPYGVDKELLSRTAVGQAEVVSALVASKPKSVTMFIDACYSGQTRGGETLLASAKPIALKTNTTTFPSNFTVITASANDQISSSSPELKHGIFSFYLMKGMEGDADGNKDGKITAGEMQEYLSDKVSRQAMSMSRKQDTQLVGDANRVLMGR
jgi:hypothetical protein